MAKTEFKPVAEYGNASPYYMTNVVTVSPLPGAAFVGSQEVSIRRLDANVYAAELVRNDNIASGVAAGTPKGAFNSAMGVAQLPLKSWSTPDWKALVWALPESAKPKAEKTAAKEGANTAYFFAVDGYEAEKAELAAIGIRAREAQGSVYEGERKALQGHHELATQFASMAAMFSRIEGDADKRSTLALRAYIDANLGDVSALKEAVSSGKNSGSKLMLMASLPLELCQRMAAGTAASIEKRWLEYRASYVQQAAQMVVVQEGDAMPEGETDWKAVLLKAVQDDTDKHAAAMAAAKEQAAKYIEANDTEGLAKAGQAMTAAKTASTRCEVVTIILQDAGRLASAAEAVAAAAKVRSETLSAAAAKAKADSDAEEAAATAAVAAKVKVASGFSGQTPEAIAKTLFAMIANVQGVNSGAVIDCLIMLQDDADKAAIEAENAAVEAAKEAADKEAAA